MRFLRFVIVVLIVVPVIGCASETIIADYDESERMASIIKIFNEEQQNCEKFLYLGVSGPYFSDYEAESVAFDNCIKNIALSIELNMRADIDIRSDPYRNYDQFKVTTQGLYDSSYFDEISKNMTIIASGRGDFETGYYVLATYGNKDAVNNVPIVQDDANNRPEWIDNPPEIPGFDVCVGSTHEYYYLQDSLEAAVYDGAVNMLLMKEDSLFTSSSVKNDSISDSLFNEDIYQIGINTLNGFSVLKYWFDIEKRIFYALVVSEDL